MVKIEGYVSKKVVKDWLENYASMHAKDRPVDAMPMSSGPKPSDGVTATQLNKVMLDQAIEALPILTKACCKARWVYGFPVDSTVNTLDISREIYYSRCDEAVELIYRALNGEKAAYIGLLRKINAVKA